MDTKRLIDALGHGRPMAKKSGELVGELNLRSARELSLLVHDARMDGHLICSGGAGYWIAAGEDELKAFYRSMKSRAIECFKAAKATREELRRWHGQMQMTEDEDGQLTFDIDEEV